jgi:signal transduction histidine kinase
MEAAESGAPDAAAGLRERLVATVNHAFRTPLTVIQASAGQLRRRVDTLAIPAPDSARLQAACGRIEGASLALVQALEGVLLIERIAAGDEPLRPRKVHAAEVLGTLVDELRPGAAGPIDADLDGARAPLRLDPQVLRRVATQLLDNALKFSPPGSPVTVSAQANARGLRLVVADRGVGIAAAEQAQLFEPFHRGEAARDLPGVGLGLCLVRELVRLAGGVVTVVSAEGAGCTVTVDLPDLTPSSSSAPPAVPASLAPEAQP